MSAYQSGKLFCKEMCQDPIFPKAPVYGFNNFYYAYGVSSAEEVRRDAAKLAECAKGLQKPFMVIDDCWQVRHDSDYNGGPWNLGNEKFPDMPGLVRKIKEKGVKAGVWFRPLLDSGENIPDEWRLPTGALDASHPGVLSRVREDITRLCEWGFGLIKHDFSTFDSFGKWGFMMQPLVTDDGWHFYDRSKTSAEILVNFYRVIYEAAAPYGTLILGCNTVGHLAAGLEHMQRTGDDTSGLLWERTMRMGVNTLAFRMPQHRTFFDCDADCYGDVGEIPWEYNQLWGDLLAKSGTSFFFSVKPGLYTEEQNRWLAAILTEASRQEQMAEPLDWQNTIYPQKWKSGDTLLSYDWYQDIGLRVVAGPGSIWEEYQEKHVF
jgi:alpha-galactosidase